MISRRHLVKLGAAGLAAPSFGCTIDREARASQAITERSPSGNCPMYRGNAARTGEMPGPAPEGGNGVDVRWEFQTGGQIRRPPAVVDGVAYVGSDDGNLYAISVQDGLEQWRFATGDGVVSGPAVSDGMVYFGSEDQYCYAIDTRTGEERWRFESGRFPGSPAVADGVVLVTGGEQFEMSVCALDPQNGDDLWRFPNESSWNLAPAVADDMVFLPTGSNVHALDLRSGEEIWRFATDGLDPLFGFELAAANDTVYVCDNTVLFALNAQDGNERWRTTPEQFSAGNIAIAGDTVFTGSSVYHTVAATNALDGSSGWLVAIGGGTPDPAQPSRYGVSNVVVADGTVFATRSFNEVYAFDMQDGRERWTFQLHLGGKNYLTAPVIVDGLVLIGSSYESSGTLYALGAL